MISLELAAGSAVLPVDASHLTAGQAAWHADPVQDSAHLGVADSVPPNDPPPKPKLTATLAGTVQFGAADSVSPDFPLPPKLLGNVATMVTPDEPPSQPKLTAPVASQMLFGEADGVTQDYPPPQPK